MSEDASGFGPLGLLLAIPLSLGFLVAWIARRANRVHAALAAALPLYVVTLALGTRWNAYVNRFVLTAIALTLPLATVVFRRQVVAGAVAAIGVATLTLAHAFNPSKPTGLEHRPPIWSLTRAEAQSLRRGELEPALAAVEKLPAYVRIGVDLDRLDREYPLYGPHLDRRLVWLEGQDALARAERLGLRYAVWGRGVRLSSTGGRWCVRTFPASGWKLLTRSTC